MKYEKSSFLKLFSSSSAVVVVLLIVLIGYLEPCAALDSDWPIIQLRTGAIHTKTATKGLDALNTRRRLLHHDCHTDHPAWGVLRGARQALVSHPHGLDHTQQHQLLDHIESSGARVMGYLPENTWAIVGSPETLAVAVNHSLVMWSGYHEPAHKIAPEWQELLGQIEAAMPSSGSSTTDFRTSSAGAVVNGTLEAQALAASVLAELPVQVRRQPGQWPQIGIRVTFPRAHNPQPMPSYHPQAVAHSLRIQRVLKEQESSTAGEAAVSDWAPLLRSTIGDQVDLINAGPHSIVVFAPPSQVHDVVEWLAERPAVRWVAPLPRIFLKNRQASVIIQSSRPAPPTSGRGGNGLDPSLHPIWAAGIQGQNQVIGQGDSGLDYQHCFFVDPTVDWASSVSVVGRARSFQSETHRKIRLYRAFADFTDANGHGTHTAGTLAGIPYGTNVEEDNGLDIGMAPAAKIAFIDLSSAADGDAILTPYDLGNDYFPYTTSVGASVHSDSWGSTSIMYDNEAAQVDSYCWENPNFLPVFPAGNDGDKNTQQGLSGETTVNSPATSKNCLAAGATQTSSEVAVKDQFAGKVWAAKAALGPNLALNFRVLQSDFSNSFSTLGNQVFKVVVAQPLSACSPLTNAAELTGSIALIERGNCTFVEKAEIAQAAGAAGVLVFDDQAAAYFVATVGGGTSGGGVSGLIPTATMPRRLGQNLLAVLSTARTVDISFTSAAEPDFGFENLASFSSQGPVGRDKRIKPDIVAPGTITSASATSADQCGVATYGGTSMATPVVAGAAILVRQYFEEGFYPSGAANAADGFNPTSALVKAVLISGAATLDGYEADTGLPIDPTPSFRQGFGRVFLGNSLLLQNNPYSPKNLALLDSVPINTGDIHQYCITAGGGPLTVTLVWTDYPGEPGAAVSLVNDLDLVVRAEGFNGQPLLGNGGGVEDSAAPDKANNIEQVTLPAVPAGRVSVEVRGSSIQAFSGSQPYALVINGDFAGVVTPPSASSGSAGAECAVVVATITSGPNGVTNEQKVSFNLGTTSGGSTGVKYECKLSNGDNVVGAPGTVDWTACTSPATYENLPDGTYTFSVRASGEKIDSSVVFTKDTAPPVVSLQSDVPATTSAATAKMTFAASDTTPVTYVCRVSVKNASPQQGDLVAGTSVAVPVQQGAPFNCTSPQTLAWLLPGQWTFAVEAADAAGNKADTTSSSWNVDVGSSTARSVRITSGPILKIPKREVEFSLTTLGPDAGSASTECSLVGIGAAGAAATMPSQWTPCSNSVSYGQPSDGEYLFASRAVGDAAVPQPGVGFPSTWAVSTFNVDSTPPTVNLTAGPSNGRAVSDTTVTFEFNFSEEGSTATCKLDAKDVPSDSIPYTPCASPVQLTNLTGGHYSFAVTPSDAVGNNGAPFVAEFVVDGMPPNITATAAVAPDNKSVKMSFTASDGITGSGVKNVTCRVRPAVLAASVQNQIDPNDPRFNWQPCTSPYTFTGVVEGHWIASVLAYDNADQASKPIETDVWVDTIAPVAAISNAPKAGVITPGGHIVFSLSDSTEKDAPGAGSPVQWQGLLKSVSEDEFNSYSRNDGNQQGAAASTAMPSIIKEYTMAAASSSASSSSSTSIKEDGELGRADLGSWANCTSECTFSGLAPGPYLFQARGIDASGNVGDATTPPVAFRMEGVSSGLPTWALIAIIVGSVVVGILVLALLWRCCCSKNKKYPPANNTSNGIGHYGNGLPNGALASSGGGYPIVNGNGNANGWNNYGAAPAPVYLNGNGVSNGYGYASPAINGNGNGYPHTTRSTTANGGHIQIPDDPIEAQELALALAASNAQQQRQQQQQAGIVPTPGDEDAELKAAMEASLAEEQRRRYSAAAIMTTTSGMNADDELNAAIQASIEEQRRQQQQYEWQPASAPPESDSTTTQNPFAEWPPRN